MNPHDIPLGLYIHIPWCIKKCPYCDFNSHALTGGIPEKAYIEQLIIDLQTQHPYVQNRPIYSIFIGGGTPSLFSAQGYADLFTRLKDIIEIPHDIEITLEANPGTTDSNRFKGFFDVGINRISIGAQSFQNDQLKILGRIHESDHIKNAVFQAKNAGFKRINIDLMFGLPKQKIEDALFDLQEAIALSPSHLSWYQFTLEPNTYFYKFPPVLPSDDERFDIQLAGQAYLSEHHFKQYEISAYAKDRDFCRHNMNYWQFGDYLGIGAGAHAKLTDTNGTIIRRHSLKHPRQYLAANADNIAASHVIEKKELPLEFMMNALRLFQPIPMTLFEERTGLSFCVIEKEIQVAMSHELLHVEKNNILLTEKGYLFLNDVLGIF